jgi:hypothetical protein
MTLDDVLWIPGAMGGGYEYAWPKPDVSVVHHTVSREYTISRYTPGTMEAREVWQYADALTAQAVLIHLTQGGNDEDAR